MGFQGDLPAINEISFFLRENEPSAAATLAERGPDFQVAMTVGIVGGREEVSDAIAYRALKVRAEILATALRSATSKADDEAQGIEARLKLLRRARFIASVLTTIASSGIIGTAFVGSKRMVTVSLGCMALLSNLIGLFADKLVLGGRHKETDLTEGARQLRRLRGNACIAQETLSRLSEAEFDDKEMAGVLKQGNRLFSELNEILAKKLS